MYKSENDIILFILGLILGLSVLLIAIASYYMAQNTQDKQIFDSLDFIASVDVNNIAFKGKLKDIRTIDGEGFEHPNIEITQLIFENGLTLSIKRPNGSRKFDRLKNQNVVAIYNTKNKSLIDVMDASYYKPTKTDDIDLRADRIKKEAEQKIKDADIKLQEAIQYQQSRESQIKQIVKASEEKFGDIYKTSYGDSRFRQFHHITGTVITAKISDKDHKWTQLAFDTGEKVAIYNIDHIPLKENAKYTLTIGMCDDKPFIYTLHRHAEK